MEIYGVAVERQGDATLVTVRCRLARGEELEAGDIERITNAALELAAPITPKMQVGIDFASMSKEMDAETPENFQEPAEASIPSTTSAPAGSKRRRGTSATTAEVPSEVGEESAPPAQTSGTRRGRAISSPKPSEPEPSSPAPAAAGVSRRRGSTSTASVTTAATASPSKDGISDADLSKAVSLAASELGEPKKVQEFVASFGVKLVAKIPQEKRAEFLRKLDTLVRLSAAE